MDNPDPFSLDRLEDIVSPSPVPWWPPAIGWYFVMAMTGLVITALAVRTFATWKRNAYRRQANKELAGLARGDFRSLSTLLKRVALVAYPRDTVASLIGPPWVTFLSTTCVGVDFHSQPASHLGSASSDTHSPACTESQWIEVVDQAKTWILRHDADLDLSSPGDN